MVRRIVLCVFTVTHERIQVRNHRKPLYIYCMCYVKHFEISLVLS